MNPAQLPSQLQTVLVLLSIINLATPVIYVLIAWKLQKLFVSKDNFEKLEHSVRDINTDIRELLQRTAHLRVKERDTG